MFYALLFFIYIFNSPQMRKRLLPTALKLLECYCLKVRFEYFEVWVGHFRRFKTRIMHSTISYFLQTMQINPIRTQLRDWNTNPFYHRTNWTNCCTLNGLNNLSVQIILFEDLTTVYTTNLNRLRARVYKHWWRRSKAHFGFRRRLNIRWNGSFQQWQWPATLLYYWAYSWLQ